MSDKHVVAALQRSVADLELRLIEVVRERDQACDDRRRARVERDLVRSAWAGAESELVSTAQQLELEREASARLRAELGERMHETAAAQREACADYVRLWRVDPRMGAIHWHSEDAVRATPLVTEVEK